jgi:hypothetical protein
MQIARRTGNLSADTQAQRMRAGVFTLGVGLALAALMMRAGAPLTARLGLIVPFWLSSQLLLSGLFNTCAGLAARGMRNLGDGPEQIASHEELTGVKCLAKRVTLISAALACIATALFVVVP